MSQAFKVSLNQLAGNQSASIASKYKIDSNNIKNSDPKKDFLEYMQDGLKTVNSAQKTADKMATNLATGKTENIHETMLAVSQAEISFKLMVQLRNKALEAYQEVMRIQV